MDRIEEVIDGHQAGRLASENGAVRNQSAFPNFINHELAYSLPILIIEALKSLAKAKGILLYSCKVWITIMAYTVERIRNCIVL